MIEAVSLPMVRSRFGLARSLALAVLGVLALAPLRARAAEPNTPNADTASGAQSAHTPTTETRIAAYALTAFGLTGSGFLNQLAGARFELAYSPRFTLAFAVAYANLKGKDGRASNVLPEVLVGYRAPLGRVVGLPFHLGGGYLPNNGPTLRVGTGLDFVLGDRSVLELTLVEPMVWVTRNRPEVSLDLGAVLAYRL